MWITPNLSWLSTDKINAADWNRIENNIRECALYLNTIGYTLPSFSPSPYSLSFDGVDDYVTIPDSASLDISSDITLEVWAFPTRVNGFYKTILTKRGVGAGNYQFYLDNVTGALSFFNGTTAYNSTYAPPINAWTHLALVIASGALTMYANGISVYTVSATVGATNSDPLTIGAFNSDQYFQGKMDEIRIWKGVARTQVQIQDNMNNQLVGNETGLTIYLKLNEGTGLTAFDGTANGNNGTLTNGPIWTTGNPNGMGNATMLSNRDMTSIDKLSSINRIEQALEYIRTRFVTPIGYVMPNNGIGPYSLSLDGSNDYVQLSSGAINSALNSNAWTIEFWANYSSIDTGVTFGPKNSAHARVIGTLWGTGSSINIAEESVAIIVPGAGIPITTNSWFQVAFAYDGTNLMGYKNGVLIFTQAYTFTGSYAGAYTFSSPLFPDQVMLEDFRVWDVTRTQAQISASMNNHLIGNESGLAGYWKLNDGSGLTAMDSTTNANNGTLTNGPTWVVNHPNAMARTWDVTSLFSNLDAIRLESNVKQLYDLGALVYNSFVYCGTQNSGSVELM